MPPFFAKFIKRASLFGWTPNSIWIRHNIVSVLATHTVDLTQCHLMCDTSVEWTPRSGCVLLIHPLLLSSCSVPLFWCYTFRCVPCRSPSSIFYSVFSSWCLRICWEAEHSASWLPLASLCFILVFAAIIMFCTTSNTSQHFTYHCFMDFHKFWFKGWPMMPWLFFQCHHGTQTFFLACAWYFETQLWTTCAP